MEKVYDMIIIGGGPGGYAAALYAARSGFQTLVLEKESVGGQMAQAHQIDNYPGFPEGIGGFELAQQMQQGAERFGVETLLEEVTAVELCQPVKEVRTEQGVYRGKTVVFATGASPRKLELPGGESVLLTDTVGFIRKLPHHLVSAFHSTLEEATLADILLIIIDVSDPCYREQLKVTEDLLSELSAGDKPKLYVFNKCDRGFAELREMGRAVEDDRFVYISAATGQGIDSLISKLEALVTDGKKRVTYFIPNSDGGALNTLYRVATVESVDYGADGITVLALADAKARGMMRKYALDDPVEKEEWE